MILGAWHVLCDLTAFTLFGIDKWKAKHHLWRIKEAVLLGVCAVGGALGGFLAMMIFHHKTKKPRFSIGVPLLLVFHIVLLWAAYAFM